MATVTLGQGIEVAIKELVPEITRVLDVTDHPSGTSPYFEAAKKQRARPPAPPAVRGLQYSGAYSWPVPNYRITMPRIGSRLTLDDCRAETMAVARKEGRISGRIRPEV